MGLGKTLQSICILASKHFERAEKHAQTKSPDSVHLPSLIICPPTLTGHWYYEIQKYAENLRPALYTGNSRERSRVLTKLSSYDVVITSYEVVRNDISSLSELKWLYCVLDEGHVIKNAKTKLTKAVKELQAQHRLILSGTPIQNNVLELWSLFDFLMPGFLGTESSFNERFGKPILANRDGKSKNSEAGMGHNFSCDEPQLMVSSCSRSGGPAQTGPTLLTSPAQGRRTARPASQDHPRLLLRIIRSTETSIRRLCEIDGRQLCYRICTGEDGGQPTTHLPISAIFAQALQSPCARPQARRNCYHYCIFSYR